MYFFPSDIVSINHILVPVCESSLVLLGQALGTLLPSLIGRHAVFVKAQEVGVETTFHERAENAHESEYNSNGQENSSHVNILIACFQVVLHS